MEFAQALQRCQDNFSSAVGREDSLVENYISFCQDEIRRLSFAVTHDSSAKALLDRWKLEMNSWVLLRDLLRLRNNLTGNLNENEIQVDGAVQSGSDRLLVSQYLSSDAEAAEFNAIKEWLESICPAQTVVEPPRTKYRPVTARSLNSGQYVQALDPDASLRMGKPISPEDAVYLENFHRQIFGYIRRGQLSKAVQMCNSASESWEAAALLGSLYYHDPNVSDSKSETVDGGDGEDDDFKESFGQKCPTGNRNRGAWMFVCFTIANETSLCVAERAIYAALCGNIANILPVCESWEDAMWAFFHSLVISLTEKFLRKFPRIRSSEYQEFMSPGIENMTLEDIQTAMSGLNNSNIRREHENFYRQFQFALISNQTSDYFQDIAAKIKSGEFFDPEFLRFLVHMILIMRSSGQQRKKQQSSNDNVAGNENEVIKCYINHLIKEEKVDLVLIYASKVEYDLQLGFIAKLLLNLADSDPMKRRQITSKAHVYGMDIQEITRMTVRKIMSQSSRPKNAREPNFNEQMSDNDLHMVSSIEWLMHEQDLPLEALCQCNALYRRFLLDGNLTAVAYLYAKSEYTPASSKTFLDRIRQTRKYENLVRELRHFHSIAKLFEKLKKAKAHLEKRPRSDGCDGSVTGKQHLQQRLFNNAVDSDHGKWKSELKSIITDLEQWFMEKIVQDRWLVDSEMFLVELPEGFDKEERDSELDICKNVYYPWMASNMYDVFYESRHTIPLYLKKALEVGNIIADNRFDFGYNYDVDHTCSPEDPRATSRLQPQLMKLLDGFKEYYSNSQYI